MTSTLHWLLFSSYYSSSDHAHIAAAAKQASTPQCIEFGSYGMIDAASLHIVIGAGCTRDGDDTDAASAGTVHLFGSQQSAQPQLESEAQGASARIAAAALLLEAHIY